MQRIMAKSPQAQRAYELVVSLQQRFVQGLQAASGLDSVFEPVEWFRASGNYGGGTRYVANDDTVFNQASVNVSQVQYEADDAKALASATALSSIIHPHNPLAPSVHLHVSWTEMKSGHGYWRVMADLNPSIENPKHTVLFRDALQAAAAQSLDDEQIDAAFAQGDRYFHIPALARHRGVCHFYLENYYTDNAEADLATAERTIDGVINVYSKLFGSTVSESASDKASATLVKPETEHFRRQLDYHSVYFFQVLTLDRGTTSGLLVHDQNDVGILGSLPAVVDKALIGSWKPNMPAPQDKLLDALLNCLTSSDAQDGSLSIIDEATKKALASAIRDHYKQYPEALALQASGEIIPPTVANHQ